MATTGTQGKTGQAQEKAQEVTGQAKEQAQQAMGQAKGQAQQTVGQARDKVREQLDQRSTRAGDQLSQQADDVRTVARQLREQGKDGPAKIADQAADRVERVGSYLREKDANQMLGDVESFARERPWAVMAGGMALGFMASRFLKASQRDRYHSTIQGRESGRMDRGERFSREPGTSAGAGGELSSGVSSGSGAVEGTEPTTPGPGGT